MLTADELADMQTVQEDAQPATATIQRFTRVSDGAGGQTETWATASTASCRVAPSGRAPEERAIAERMSAVSIWTLTLPADTSVLVADRIAVGTRTFEVVAALARSYETARRVICTEVL